MEPHLELPKLIAWGAHLVYVFYIIIEIKCDTISADCQHLPNLDQIITEYINRGSFWNIGIY